MVAVGTIYISVRSSQILQGYKNKCNWKEEIRKSVVNYALNCRLID